MKVRMRVDLYLWCVLLIIVTPVFANYNKYENQDEDQAQEIQRNQFPDDFFFGTSTSSYQIEGAYLKDGKGLSNWDVFSHIPGNMENNDNGDIADDHYHRYMEDIEIVHSLGTNAYRFSISWARILPRGKLGGVNPKGIAFYNNIINAMLSKGIEPFVTLYHFDLPNILEERYGGWLNPMLREELVHFATICFREFGDRVKYWMTINEPMHLAEFAYLRGQYPPARCSPPFGNCSAGDSDREPLIVLHNLVISHAMAVDVYRKQFQHKQRGFIGIVINSFMYEPLRQHEDDQQAANRALAFNTAWALDPIIFGEYPKEMRESLGMDQILPKFTQSEKELFLRAGLDFIGVNYYTTFYAKDCLNSPCSPGNDRPIRGFVETSIQRDDILIGEPTGMNHFFVVPRGIEKVVTYIKKRYNNRPMFITENGFSSLPEQSEQQLLQDQDRVHFHKAHLSVLANAIREGANVRGYFIWSLMDNLEWVKGYGVRFGLYYVDRTSLQRSPKISAQWFTNFLKNFTTKPSFAKTSLISHNVAKSNLEMF